jgi:hypothetical protein
MLQQRQEAVLKISRQRNGTQSEFIFARPLVTLKLMFSNVYNHLQRPHSFTSIANSAYKPVYLSDLVRVAAGGLSLLRADPLCSRGGCAFVSSNTPDGLEGETKSQPIR